MKRIGLHLLRVITSLSMLLGHGVSKFMKLYSGDYSFPDPIGIGEKATLILAVFSECICSIILLTGFLTRLALTPLIITMLTAFFIVHSNDNFASREKAFLYLLIYIVLFIENTRWTDYWSDYWPKQTYYTNKKRSIIKSFLQLILFVRCLLFPSEKIISVIKIKFF